jgi:hypothetical protein
MGYSRKHLIAFIFAVLSLSVGSKVFASDDGENHGDSGGSQHSGESGGDGGGGDGGGGDGGGGDGGGGDGGGGDSGDNDSGENSHQGSGSATTPISNSGQSITQNQVRDAVQSGKAVSLPLVLAYMANNYKGQVLDIKLRLSLYGYYYDVKYLDASNHLLTVALDAKTLTKR